MAKILHQTREESRHTAPRSVVPSMAARASTKTPRQQLEGLHDNVRVTVRNGQVVPDCDIPDTQHDTLHGQVSFFKKFFCVTFYI